MVPCPGPDPGWLVGIVGGTWIVFNDGLVPVHKLMLGGVSTTVYIGLLAFAANVLVAILVNLALRVAVPQAWTAG